MKRRKMSYRNRAVSIPVNSCCIDTVRTRLDSPGGSERAYVDTVRTRLDSPGGSERAYVDTVRTRLDSPGGSERAYVDN